MGNPQDLYESSCHVYSGPCTIKVSGKTNVLNYKGRTKDAYVFAVPGVNTVLIYDFRPETMQAMEHGSRTDDYSRVLTAFQQPGMVEIGHEEHVYYVEIRPLSGPARLVLKLLGKKTIWIATNLGQRLPVKNYLIAEHLQSHRAGKYSLFCLYSH